MKNKWSAIDIPDLKGQTAIVTGANNGVGYEIAYQLAAHGAHVVLASRNQKRLDEAASKIAMNIPGASIKVQLLDLANLASVRRFANLFSETHSGLDILVNNAGISGGPRRLTKDGFETQFQVNYLGHFALTGLLLPALQSRVGSRVVTQSSDIASQGKIDFDDLLGERKYGVVTTYAQSKLANLLFAFEFDRRCRQAGVSVTSLATNPGVAKSGLMTGKQEEWGRSRNGLENLLRIAQMILALPAEKGALPSLYQATDPSAQSSEYVVGASWPKSGYPSVGKIPLAALDQVAAKRLWEVSESMTEVYYNFLPIRKKGK